MKISIAKMKYMVLPMLVIVCFSVCKFSGFPVLSSYKAEVLRNLYVADFLLENFYAILYFSVFCFRYSVGLMLFSRTNA